MDRKVADRWDEMEKHAASDVHAKRLKSQEIRVTTVRGEDNFHCFDEDFKQAGHVVTRTLFHRNLSTEDHDAEGNLEAGDPKPNKCQVVLREATGRGLNLPS